MFPAPGTSPIAVVVGLGNPGPQYERTRHNVGFRVLDRLVPGGAPAFVRERKWSARAARIPGDPVLYAKPQTFMNLSGQAVAAIVRFHKLAPHKVLVVYDDADLPFGQLRFREKGSAGGHNGVRSLIERLGTEVFPRLKIGVGGEGRDPRIELADYVLAPFSPDEEAALENCLDRAAAAVRYAVAHGPAAAMEHFNQRQQAPPGPQDAPPAPPQKPLPEKPNA